MNKAPDDSAPLMESVLFASDFSAGSMTAFRHALKAALVARSKLTILHLSPGVAAAWTEFPGVHETLERWKLLPPGSSRSDVPQPGIEVSKVVARAQTPLKTVVDHLKANPVDLIVLATHANDPEAGWMKESITDPLARKAGQMTLCVPDGVAGFVSAQDGSISLNSVVIPIASKPEPQPAVAAAARLVARLQCPQGTFTLLYVGEPGARPVVQCPIVPGWEWNEITQTGDVIHGIVDTAAKVSADLIVMATNGRNGFLDALRGSHSERVLRTATCPLLTVPNGSLARAALA